jgi:hypothetical protein
MTITSLTEQKLRDHRRNIAIHEEFARTADEDGKIYMSALYRNIAQGHLTACQRLEDKLKKLRDDGRPVHATAARSASVLDIGREAVSV